jgi:hypothetical protein
MARCSTVLVLPLRILLLVTFCLCNHQLDYEGAKRSTVLSGSRFPQFQYLDDGGFFCLAITISFASAFQQNDLH